MANFNVTKKPIALENPISVMNVSEVTREWLLRNALEFWIDY